MVDPRVIHSITIEACTGFLLLAGAAVIVKVASDWWLRSLRGRSARLDRWAISASKFAEPASYFALIAGHNKILVTSVSQTLFIGAILLRAR